ncbi:MAG: DUF2029 domain-containing protein [Anaerolineales bacterium]|nr:DUF2029 domain-containing protein [Anaerolineales bacterium]
MTPTSAPDQATSPKLQPALLGVIALALLALVLTLSAIPAFRPIDFGNYMTAAGLLLHGVNPYSAVEFFAPPWSILLLAPFTLLPPDLAAGAWLILSAFAQVACAALALRWLGIPVSRRKRAALLSLSALLPAAIFTYLTGQVSSFVALALLLALWACARPAFHPAVLGLLLGAAALKPHLAAIPALLCALELLRHRQWTRLAWTGLIFALLAGFSFLLLPGWVPALMDAWLGGAFRGGPELAARGYLGLLELGVPYILLLPALAYTLYACMKEGLTPRVAALALAAGLLLTPYTRVYDQVLLTFPAMLTVCAFKPGKRLAAALILIAAFGLPLTPAWMLAPAACCAGLALLPPTQLALTEPDP